MKIWSVIRVSDQIKTDTISENEFLGFIEYCFSLSFFSFLVLVQIERAGSKALFAVVTEISDSVLRGAETNGFNGMVMHDFIVNCVLI